MYSLLLPIHNILRWVFLALSLWVLLRSILGLSGNKPFSAADKKIGGILLGFAHLQLLIGLILWFISPNVQGALTDMGAAMKDSALRLKLIEHPLTMIIAIVLIQIGRIKTKKAYADSDKHRRTLIYLGIGLVLILSRIPWTSSQLFPF